eukprot:1369190-Amphidinium_carterae.1
MMLLKRYTPQALAKHVCNLLAGRSSQQLTCCVQEARCNFVPSTNESSHEQILRWFTSSDLSCKTAQALRQAGFARATCCRGLKVENNYLQGRKLIVLRFVYTEQMSICEETAP